MPSTQERFDKRGAKLWLWRALVKVCVDGADISTGRRGCGVTKGPPFPAPPPPSASLGCGSLQDPGEICQATVLGHSWKRLKSSPSGALGCC